MAAKMGCFCAATRLSLACAYLAVPGEVGRRVGLRRVGMNRETGNVSFWVAAPLGVEAMDRRNFGIVAASLWHHGRWGGAESVIATNFRRQVAELISQPHLLLREFQRFSHVLQRPAIAAELSSERENLLSQLIEQLAQLETFHRRDKHAGGGKDRFPLGCEELGN